MQINPFSPKPYAVLLASVGLAGAMPASATIIDGLSASASASVFGQPPESNGPNVTTPTTVASAADSDTVSGNYSSSNGYAFGSVSGVYGVGANGDGVFDSKGQFIRTWNVSNDSGVAQNYSFSFYIYGGSMFANTNGATGSGFAEYLLDILWGGVSRFDSAARINSDGTFSESGTKLNFAGASGTSYNWGGTIVTLELGLLNPGQSALLQYDLIGHAFGDYGFDGPGSGYGYGCGYGAPTGAVSTDSIAVGCTGRSQLFMGDPSGVEAEPFLGPPHVTSVPEPGSLGLLATGLLAALGRWRRTSRS